MKSMDEKKYFNSTQSREYLNIDKKLFDNYTVNSGEIPRIKYKTRWYFEKKNLKNGN